MKREAFQWLSHLQRSNVSHDDHPELTEELIALGHVQVEKTWMNDGKPCRLIKATSQRVETVEDADVQVPDFSKGPFGLLVTYSDHWYNEHCQQRPENPKLGIVVDRKFYEDGKRRAICWPVIHWEGAVTESCVHPMNVVPYRPDQKLPMRAMDQSECKAIK